MNEAEVNFMGNWKLVLISPENWNHSLDYKNYHNSQVGITRLQSANHLEFIGDADEIRHGDQRLG